MYKLLSNNHSDNEFEKPVVHPTAKLIKHRFSSWYTGKLTWREINEIKHKMDNIKNKLDKYTSSVSDELKKLYNLKKEHKDLCFNSKECSDNLDEHIKTCVSTYKCTKSYVAYECKSKDNGKCSHFYMIENLDANIEYIEECIDDYKDKYIDLEITYERALALKEDRLEEYERQSEERFEEYSYALSMGMI